MASLSIIFGGKEERVCELDRPRMVVGRDQTCEIPIDNLGISRQHCEFIVQNEAFILRDMGSANGTYVNGRKIVEHYLNDGDEIHLGKYTLRFINRNQAQAQAERDPNVVPDTLNTYVMDGSKIQEQLARMKTGQTAGPQGIPGTHPHAQTAGELAQQMDPTAMGSSGGGGGGGATTALLIASVILNVILIALLALKFAGTI